MLDGAAYRDTLRRGTVLNLADETPVLDSATSLEEQMRTLLADEATADVRLVVRYVGNDLEFSAHKCVLASRSAYFRALFSSEFRERCQSRLPLEDIVPDQLLLLLNFIYTDEWVEDSEFALDMIPIADRFSVLDLKRLCERTLICTMSVDNVARIFALADRYACARLRNRALMFMTESHNFHLVMKTDGFAELDKILILEVLHSHRTTPAPSITPSEPLPGNSVTAAKAGQSKTRDHRHARGGGAGGGGTARAVPTATSGSDGGRSNASASSNNSVTVTRTPTGVRLEPRCAVPSVSGAVPSRVQLAEVASTGRTGVDEPSIVAVSSAELWLSDTHIVGRDT